LRGIPDLEFAQKLDRRMRSVRGAILGEKPPPALDRPQRGDVDSKSSGLGLCAAPVPGFSFARGAALARMLVVRTLKSSLAIGTAWYCLGVFVLMAGPPKHGGISTNPLVKAVLARVHLRRGFYPPDVAGIVSITDGLTGARRRLCWLYGGTPSDTTGKDRYASFDDQNQGKPSTMKRFAEVYEFEAKSGKYVRAFYERPSHFGGILLRTISVLRDPFVAVKLWGRLALL
jgi:hypothetical protein